MIGFDAAEPGTSLALWRDRRVIDQRVQPAALRLQPFLHHGDRLHRVVRVGEVDLDVVLWPRLPRTILGKAVTRAGDHPPASRGEALHRRVADAPGRAGQDQGLALFIRDLRPGKIGPGADYG